MPGRKLCQRGDCRRLLLSESLCTLGLALVSRAVGGGAVRPPDRAAVSLRGALALLEQASFGLSLLTSRAPTSATARVALAKANSRHRQIRNMAESLGGRPGRRPATGDCRL